MALPKKETRIPIRRPGDDRVQHGDSASGPGPDPADQNPVAETSAAQNPAPTADRAQAQPEGAAADAGVDWRDTALRLKAEMENYRKRQRRWAEDEITREKADLLLKFLEVVDNLEYALQHIDPQDPAHQGLRVAYDGILKLLLHEGVERIFAKNQLFDPNFHEAVAMVPAERGRDDELRVMDVLSPGYRFNERVLRPAKVVVAKPGV
jgi:molecular chaperone GrpE